MTETPQLPAIPTRADEGARVLWRHWQTNTEPVAGWLVEFSTDGKSVRIRETQDATEAGVWQRCREIRITARLSEATAPQEPPTIGDMLGALFGGKTARRKGGK